MKKEIKLSNNAKRVQVDEADFDILNGFDWKATKDRRGVLYATTRIGKKRVSMHRMVMGFPELIVDHIDGDGLNNTRDNLRCVTQSQNMANSRRHHDGTSKYKGVTYDAQGKTKNKWRAVICVNGKRHRLGRYATEKAAALAYDAAARKLNPEHAKLNFP